MCEKPGDWRQVFVTPALGMESETGRSLAIDELMTTRFCEKACLKKENKVESDPERHPFNINLVIQEEIHSTSTS